MGGASTPIETYVVKGHKISINALSNFFRLLSPEATKIVRLTHDVITILHVRAAFIFMPYFASHLYPRVYQAIATTPPASEPIFLNVY